MSRTDTQRLYETFPWATLEARADRYFGSKRLPNGFANGMEGWTLKDLSRVLGVNWETIARWVIKDVPMARADQVAVAFGDHPTLLVGRAWEDWADWMSEQDPDRNTRRRAKRAAARAEAA